MANTPPALALVAVEAGPPPPPTAHATIHSLPLELVHHIIKMALPRVRFDTFKERYETLLVCCLVCKAWHEGARRELWKHVHITYAPIVERFEAALELDDAPVQLVRSLRLERHERVSCKQVQVLMHRLRGCVELWVIGSGAESIMGKLDLSAFASRIRYLHLDYAIPLPAPEPALAFPHLVELSLSYIFEVPKVLNFLQHTELPQLRSLGILGWQGMDWRALSPLQHGAIDRLTSQLESFSFMPEEEADELEALDLDWGNFTNLRRLALPVANATARILARIPVKLQALRLVPTFSWEEDTRVLENVLTEWAPCMELLHRLVLPEAAKGDERFARLCLAKDLQEVYNLSETDEFYWDACDYFFVWW